MKSDPVMIFPTIYFIGNNGQPLEVCIGPVNADELLERFNKALEVSYIHIRVKIQHLLICLFIIEYTDIAILTKPTKSLMWKLVSNTRFTHAPVCSLDVK